MRYLLGLILFISILCAVEAAPIISNGSFEQSAKEAGFIPSWSTVAWGTPEAKKSAMSVVQLSNAPSGKYVAKTSHDINQISAIASSNFGKDKLIPGMWYEASCKIKCENLTGQGAFIMAEFWRGKYGAGGVDSEHLVGDTNWQTATVRFIAPSSSYSVIISLWTFGGPGKAYFDDVKIKEIPSPAFNVSNRRVLDSSPWGMFTCYNNYLHEYCKDMADAKVHWQRIGGGVLNPSDQALIAKNNMSLQVCLDGMPAPSDSKDPCYPITNSVDYSKYLKDVLSQSESNVRVLEVFNEPNTNVSWTLPAYANLLNLVGNGVKSSAKGKDILVASGGVTTPYIGYMEACLKRGADKALDMIVFHPYCVDEALDSQIYALSEMCKRNGRPDMLLAINETGFPTWDPKTGIKLNEWFVSEQEQSSDVVKLHVQAIAHKLSFVTYLGWNDFAPENSDAAKNMGLVRVDGSPKPSLTAYKFMTSTLGDPHIINWVYKSDGTRIYEISGADGKTVWALWNGIRKAEVTVDVKSLNVFKCNVYGTKLTVSPLTGKIKLVADSDPIYLIPTDEKQ